MWRIGKKVFITNIKEYNKIKDKIAFICYSNLNYKELIYRFELGKWLKVKKPKIYILNKNIPITIIKEEKNQKKTNNKTILLLTDDIRDDININEKFRVIYNEPDDKITSIYSRVERVCKIKIIPTCFEINNKTNKKLKKDMIKALNNIKDICIKNDYQKSMYYTFKCYTDSKEYQIDTGYNIDILETSFNTIEGLTKKINNTYNCKIENSMLSPINIKNKNDIFLKIFISQINEEDLSKEDKGFINNEITTVENSLGKFIMMYKIKDGNQIDDLNLFVAPFEQFYIIFEKCTLIITIGGMD